MSNTSIKINIWKRSRKKDEIDKSYEVCGNTDKNLLFHLSKNIDNEETVEKFLNDSIDFQHKLKVEKLKLLKILPYLFVHQNYYKLQVTHYKCHQKKQWISVKNYIKMDI